MKNLLTTIGNLLLFIHFVTVNFWFVLWYGKLPKMSIYHHQVKYPSMPLKKIYEDFNCQVLSEKDVPKKVKEMIISNYIDALFTDKRFKSNIVGTSIPIFDGKEIVGSEGVIGILQDVKLKTINQ